MTNSYGLTYNVHVSHTDLLKKWRLSQPIRVDNVPPPQKTSTKQRPTSNKRESEII